MKKNEILIIVLSYNRGDGDDDISCYGYRERQELFHLSTSDECHFEYTGRDNYSTPPEGEEGRRIRGR